MTIYSPYFYIIKHLPSGKLYIGSKYGKDAYPEKFMKEDGYQTSSPKIHELIEQDGLNSFEIIRMKLFSIPQEAYNYESRFLRKIKPNTNDKVFNTHSNAMLAFGTIAFENAMIKTYGVAHYSLHRDFQKKKTVTNQRKYGVDHAIQNEEILQKSRETNMKRRGVMYPTQDPSVIEKQKKTSLKRYGVTNPGQSKDAKIKRRKTSLEKYGTEAAIS